MLMLVIHIYTVVNSPFLLAEDKISFGAEMTVFFFLNEIVSVS